MSMLVSHDPAETISFGINFFVAVALRSRFHHGHDGVFRSFLTQGEAGCLRLRTMFDGGDA
jgi:hypothetical protein